MTDEKYDSDETVNLIEARLRRGDRFRCCERRPEYAPNKIVFQYDSGYYPMSVADARLEIAWFENEDFSLHYHETHQNGLFSHRWDRHP